MNCSGSLAHTLCGTVRTDNVGISGCNAILIAVTSGSGPTTLPLVGHFCSLNFGVRTARKATGFLGGRKVHAHIHTGLAISSDSRVLGTLERNRVSCIVGAVSVDRNSDRSSNSRVHHTTIRGGMAVFASLSAIGILLSILRRVALNISAVSTRWSTRPQDWGVFGRGVCGVLSGRVLIPNIFGVHLKNSARCVAGPNRFVGVTLSNGFLHHPVSIYSCSRGAVAVVCGAINRNALRLSGVRPNRVLSYLAKLKGNCSVSGSGRPLIVNNKMNVPPLCGLAGYLITTKRVPSIVLKFGAGSRVFCRRRFGTLNIPMAITATSNDCNIRNFMASTLPNSCSCFCAYNPVPVFGTVRTGVGASNRCDFRRHVNYNFNTYVNYSYRAGCNGGQVYGSNPILRERRVV